MGKVTIGVLVLLGLGACGVASCGISTSNDFVRQEAGIKAQFTQNKNNYGQFRTAVAEMAQVPEMYRDDLLKVYDKVMVDRYGPEGSKALFQFIQEHNPTLPPDMYTKIQQKIEAGHLDFEQNQKALIDRKRTYEASLGVFPNSMVASFMGYPKINLDDYKIITSSLTEKVYETGKDDPVKLR